MIQKEQQTKKPLSFTQQKPNKQSTTTYLSFVQKMKLDFSAKLQKNNNNNSIYDSVSKFDEPKSFRQSNVNTNEFETKYNSIQLSIPKKQQPSILQAPQIPRLLRNRSISSHSRQSSTITTFEASLKPSHRIPLSQQSIDFSSSYNKNSHIPSSLLSNQQQKQLRQSLQKKSNHDLMRKTKSKFFQSINMKKNQELCKIKGLENVENLVPVNVIVNTMIAQNRVERKRTMSKQKLRIFSIV